MAELDLSETGYMMPGCCQGCEHKGSSKVDCPTNVALGTLGRIAGVVLDENYELDSREDAVELAGQLPKLSEAAAQCGDLLTTDIIQKPFDVTTDLSLTNFTVHSPA
jgi:hypothetical protein